MNKPSRDEELRALVASWEKTAQKQGGYSSQTAHNMAVGDCANALAEILARHDAQGEAVAWLIQEDDTPDIVGRKRLSFTKPDSGNATPLGYLHPAPTSKREAVVTQHLEPGHNAFPWHTEIGSFGYVIDANGDTVAICEDDDGIGKQDAAFIVASCNAYRTAALAAKEADGWLPIESAPRDGTPVLLYDERSGWEDVTGVCVARWQSVDWQLLDSATCDEYPGNCPIHPTRWRQLPAAPVTDKAKEG